MLKEQLDRIMRPQSVAVVGASTKEHTIGSDIMKRLQEYKFTGKIYPINPKGGVIEGLQAYTSVLEVPDSIDLAIIVVNSKFVLSTIDQCNEKGIKGLCIITAGFKETGKYFGCAGGKDNNYFWNIGGWNNSVTCFQRVKDGVKSDQVSGTVNGFTVKTGQTYKLKIVVTDKNVKCYIDDKLNIDYDLPETNEAEAYQVVSTDETNDIIIKLVNEKTQEKTFAIDLENAGTFTGDADVDTVWAKDLTADNILGRPEAAVLTSSQVSGISEKFNYTVPPCSVTVLRVHR